MTGRELYEMWCYERGIMLDYTSDDYEKHTGVPADWSQMSSQQQAVWINLARRIACLTSK